jgi:hypothetical protein
VECSHDQAHVPGKVASADAAARKSRAYKIEFRSLGVHTKARLHELVVQHGARLVARGVQELFEPLARPVVDAMRPQHEQLLARQVLLHGAQRLHLAADTDEEQLLDL